MRRDTSDPGVIRHVMGDDTILNWHKAEDRCGICPWDDLFTAAKRLPRAVGPFVRPEAPVAVFDALDELDDALLNVVS